jgi:group I intron endonuclease
MIYVTSLVKVGRVASDVGIPGLVYIARNRLNGKVYVGQTTYTLDQRRRSHERSSKAGSNAVFHRAIRKHGKENFSWQEVCRVYENDGYGLGWHEQSIIHFLKKTGNTLYNSGIGGVSPALGMSHTETNKQLMGEAAKQRWEGRRASDLYPLDGLKIGPALAYKEFGIPKTTYYRMKRNDYANLPKSG